MSQQPAINTAHRPAQRWRRARGLAAEHGGAVVEFAIVVPLFVFVFLFAQWFWELLHVRLKTQEIARYAAWEATAFPLHDYEMDPWGQYINFGAMAASVMAEARLRYANLESADPLGGGAKYLVATVESPQVWVPPSAGGSLNAVLGNQVLSALGVQVADMALRAAGIPYVGNEEEELLYGGTLPNLIFRFVGPVLDVMEAMRWASSLQAGSPTQLIANVKAAALLALGRDAGSDSGQGAGGFGRVFGPHVGGVDTWGFNRRGYVRAVVETKVKNNWFNVQLMGKPIFERQDIEFVEQHGVLADSWRLNDAKEIRNREQNTDEAPRQREGWWDRIKGWGEDAWETASGRAAQASDYYAQAQRLSFGRSGPGFKKQLERMYFMHPRALSVAKAMITSVITPLKVIGASGVVTLTPPRSLADFSADELTPSLVSRSYGRHPETEELLDGLFYMKEDVGMRSYNTLPHLGEYAKTRVARGIYFMGCPQPEQRGCTHGLAQSNPFGDYLLRE